MTKKKRRSNLKGKREKVKKRKLKRRGRSKRDEER